MTGDRWQRVKAIFQLAAERPAGDRDAFLAAATDGDEALRLEVESLLARDADEDSPLERVSREGAALLVGSASEASPAFRRGHRVGSYEVVALLGVGAMGEVYRTRDLKLSREVALKVLAGTFAGDPGRLARFRREAQLLAALNHPNIGAIYGVEEAAGVQALVLELVDGPTLADRIAGGPLAKDEALAIARQMAEALEAAHEMGIVHRDLKPSNVKVRADGVVKVLDFGLAKAVALPPAATGGVSDPAHLQSAAVTHDGLILGTAAYMAPEQAKGLPVDKRADIWAFGCVLFEMLSGRPAFRGDTLTDVLAAVVKDPPDWSAVPDDTPPALRTLLRRCLTKDPRQRLQAIGDARIEIDALDELPSLAAPVQPSRSAARWLPWAAAAAVVALIVALLVQQSGRAIGDPLANARFSRLTNWEGSEEGAEISPDGKFVAFLSDRAGEFDLWLTQIGTEQFSNLTRDVPALGGSGVIVRKLGFSGDGTHLWFNLSDGKPLMLMPLTGGGSRAFLGDGANVPAWAPDGKRLVYVYKADRDDPVLLAEGSGANGREILPRGTLKNNNPVWSPDGEWIYFVRGAEPQDETGMDIWRMRSSGGAPEQLTTQNASASFLAPIDARTLLYVSRDQDWSGPWLWALDLASRTSRRVRFGVDQFMSIASSRDGRRIVATVANPSAEFWRVPLTTATAEERDALPYKLPVPTGRVSAPRFAGKALFYLSTRGTADGLWKLEDGTATEVWGNVDGALSEPPAVSPDGRRVVVVVRRQTERRLSILSAEGTDRRSLADFIETECHGRRGEELRGQPDANRNSTCNLRQPRGIDKTRGFSGEICNPQSSHAYPSWRRRVAFSSEITYASRALASACRRRNQTACARWRCRYSHARIRALARTARARPCIRRSAASVMECGLEPRQKSRRLLCTVSGRACQGGHPSARAA